MAPNGHVSRCLVEEVETSIGNFPRHPLFPGCPTYPLSWQVGVTCKLIYRWRIRQMIQQGCLLSFVSPLYQYVTNIADQLLCSSQGCRLVDTLKIGRMCIGEQKRNLWLVCFQSGQCLETWIHCRKKFYYKGLHCKKECEHPVRSI